MPKPAPRGLIDLKEVCLCGHSPDDHKDDIPYRCNHGIICKCKGYNPDFEGRIFYWPRKKTFEQYLTDYGITMNRIGQLQAYKIIPKRLLTKYHWLQEKALNDKIKCILYWDKKRRENARIELRSGIFDNR